MRRRNAAEQNPNADPLKIPTAPPEGTVATPPEGLSEAEASRRAAAGQSNRRTEASGKSIARIVSDNLFTLFNLLNFALAACLALVGSWRNMLFLGVVFSNTLIGTIQELRARATLNKLRLLDAKTVRVIRDGKERKCVPEELVLGDLAVFRIGDQLPADAVIADGVCAADESLLTGESEPVMHKAGELLMSGSFLTEGKVTVQLIAVGDEAYAARLMREAKRIRSPKSELMTELNKLVSLVSKLLVPIGVVLFLEEYFLLKSPLSDAIPKAVAAMIGMIPEGLILLTSVALTAGVIKLGRRKTLVQELFGIETLARVDVLCVDKTGTLTTGEMTFERFVPLAADEAELREKTAAFTAAFEAASGTIRAIADAIGQKEKTATSVLPFSSTRKKSAASFPDGKTLILGAPSFVTDEPIPEALAAAEQGYRVLLLAEAEGEIQNSDLPPVTRLSGLILLRETLRPSAKDTLEWFRREGVSVRIMSGDDPRTVAAVARALGLEGCERITDCTSLSDGELRVAVKDGVIFGRLTPERKRILVEALKAAGHHVAMTGDGVNDIPSLKAADCSVAMAGGADATEHAAQLVLLNNDFNALPSVVAEGRRVIGNITRTASLFLQKTLYSFVLSLLNILIALFLPLHYPFEPIHLTLISALTVGVPSFFLALEPSAERAAGHFLKRVLLKAAPGAAGVVCCALSAMIANYFGTPDAIASTMAVLSAGVIGLGNLILTCRPFSKLRIAVCAAMSVGFVCVAAFLPAVFKLNVAEMTARHWIMLSAITAAGVAVLILGTLIVRPILLKLEKE
ncbi:MAG: HAD-IC family P-type ATPase [Clostridia bacterium]|nr:HAD-IC family P-type ATPase [Clostridia bacterium]